MFLKQNDEQKSNELCDGNESNYESWENDVDKEYQEIKHKLRALIRTKKDPGW